MNHRRILLKERILKSQDVLDLKGPLKAMQSNHPAMSRDILFKVPDVYAICRVNFEC